MGRGSDPPFVVVGHITKPHGTKGEFHVWPLTDRPDSTFLPGMELRIGDREGERPDEFFPPVRIASVRPYRRGFLVRFEGVEDRDRADFLRDRYLVRPFEEIEPAEEDEVFYHELLGMRVATADGRELGRVREVYSLEPADLLDVSDGKREYLIPFSRRVVVETDVPGRRLVIDPPEGLLDL
jgi:16S rRNA processing protein RimM